MTSFATVRVAAVQATPVILDAEATIDKAIRLIGEAAADGAELVVLPETFVPLYPSNGWARHAARFGGSDELWERLWENSVDVPGPLVDRLVAVCGERTRTRPCRATPTAFMSSGCMITVLTMLWYSGLSLPTLTCCPCLVVRPAFMR